MSYKDPEKRKQYDQEYYRKHYEEKKRYRRKWKKDNPGYKKEYDQRPDVKKHQKEYQKEWQKENREKCNRRVRYKRANDLKFRLNDSMSISVRLALKGNKSGRHWETLVGYTIQDLINRLSVNFQEGMSWQNYGDWHLDHKKPVSLFHYKTPEEQAFKDCWSLANLQPLWAIDNLIKSNKF